MLQFLILCLGMAQAEVPAIHYAASKPCRDHRYPMVHDEQIIVCNDRQLPTLSFHPATGRVESLSKMHRLPFATDLRPEPRIGSHLTETPAVIVWETNGPGDDVDLWVQRRDRPERRGLDVGPGDQHHPVSSGDWIGWVSQGNIKIWNTVSGTKETIEATTGFNASPALQDGWVCWEFRSPQDIDIRCSNGFRLHRPGHQTHPMLLGQRLLFREKGLLMSVEARVTE